MTLQELLTLGTSGNATGGTNAPYFDGSQPCAETDPEIFFPEIGHASGATKVAIQICRQCKFQTPCLEYSLDFPQSGIWGGTTVMQRRKLKAKRRLK